MRSLILIVGALACTSLSACKTADYTTQSPAPLSNTVIDDRAVRYAFQALDAAASLADAALDAKLIIPGSAKALAIADGLDKTRHWLNAASAAQKAGSVTSYNTAFANATAAMAEVNKALGKNTSSLVVTTRVASVQTVVERLRA